MTIRSTDATTIFLVIFYSVVCVMILLGNCLVIYVVLRYSSMNTPTNLYLVNLSIADTLFLVSLPLFITLMLLQHCIFGSVLCLLYNLVDSGYKYAGTYTRVALSCDRYLAPSLRSSLQHNALYGHHHHSNVGRCHGDRPGSGSA